MPAQLDIDPPKWGDLETVAVKSMEIATISIRLIDDLHVNLESGREVWADFASHFWMSMKDEPT